MPSVRVERPSHACLAYCAAATVLVALLAASPARAASVSWVGPSLGGVWGNDANWSGNAVPGPADDVTISGATVAVDGARMVGGSLTLSGNAELNVETGTSLTVTGPAHIDDGRLFVMGGQVDLSTVTAVTRTRCEPALAVPVIDFITVGSGGSIDLSGVQTLAVNVPSCPQFDFSITVLAGGTLDLAGLQSISAGTPHTVTFNVYGVVSLPQLAATTSTNFVVVENATVDLPALTSFGAGMINVVAGHLVANALTHASDLTFFAGADDAIVMNALASVTGGRLFLSAPAHATLPTLTTLLDVSIQIPDGAQLDVPLLTSYTSDRSDTLLTGGVLNAPALRSLVNVNLGVAMGVSTMSLPGVTSYSWTLCEGMGLGTFIAGMAGKIDLSGVQTFTIDVPGCGMLGFNIGAVTGATIDLSGLKTIEMPGNQLLAFLASDAGSVIDLSSLTTYPAAPKVVFLETDSGRIIHPAGGGGGGGDGGAIDAIRGHIADMRSLLAGDGVDQRAQKKIGKLLTKTEQKLGAAAGSGKRAKRARKQTRSLLAHVATLVRKLQPKHITDPAVGAALAAADAEALQAALTL